MGGGWAINGTTPGRAETLARDLILVLDGLLQMSLKHSEAGVDLSLPADSVSRTTTGCKHPSLCPHRNTMAHV